jgi:hypothetical protein
MVIFRNALHSNAINKRVVETHGDKVFAAFVAIAILFRYPHSIASSGLCAGPGNIREATLPPKQPSMLLAEPDKGGDHLLFID